MYKKKHVRPLIIKYSLLLFLPYQAGCYLQPLQENNDFQFHHLYIFSLFLFTSMRSFFIVLFYK